MKRKEAERPRSGAGGRGASRTRPFHDHYERNRERYYPLFENLAAAVVDPRAYFQTLQEFVKDELQRRVGKFVSGTILLAAGVFFLFAVLTFLTLSAFLYLDSLIQNTALTAFLLSWAALLLLFALIFAALRQFRGAVGARNTR